MTSLMPTAAQTRERAVWGTMKKRTADRTLRGLTSIPRTTRKIMNTNKIRHFIVQGYLHNTVAIVERGKAIVPTTLNRKDFTKRTKETGDIIVRYFCSKTAKLFSHGKRVGRWITLRDRYATRLPWGNSFAVPNPAYHMYGMKSCRLKGCYKHPPDLLATPC